MAAVAAMGEPRSEIRCHTPFCQFLVHPDVQYGGFCCCKCYYRFESRAACKRKHGENCKGNLARPTAQPAPYAPPVWFRTECFATDRQPASSSETRYSSPTNSTGQRQADHDGGHPLAKTVRPGDVQHARPPPPLPPPLYQPAPAAANPAPRVEAPAFLCFVCHRHADLYQAAWRSYEVAQNAVRRANGAVDAAKSIFEVLCADPVPGGLVPQSSACPAKPPANSLTGPRDAVFHHQCPDCRRHKTVLYQTALRSLDAAEHTVKDARDALDAAKAVLQILNL